MIRLTLENIIEKNIDLKNIFDEVIEEDKSILVNRLVSHGKLVDSNSFKAELVYKVGEIISNVDRPNKLYRINKIQDNGNLQDTALIFINWWGHHYEKRIHDFLKKSIDSFLGKGHYELFQYLNKEYITTDMVRVHGTEDIGPYYFYHSARIANYLNIKKSPRIAIDLALAHDFIEDMTKYRNIKEYNIEELPEYRKIGELFKNEPEYATTLLTFLKTLTKKPQEKPEEYLLKLIKDCETFANSTGLVKKYFYVPALVKLADYIDNTVDLTQLTPDMQDSRNDKNYVLLTGINSLINKFNIHDDRLLELRKELLEVSIRRTEDKTAHERFTGIWKQLYPVEEIPAKDRIFLKTYPKN